MNVLLLDDDRRVADSMTGALEDRGHTVWWVPSLAAARSLLSARALSRDTEFSLAILDLNLPDGLGTDLLPLDFPACIYSGLPDDVGDVGVPVFSKGDPFALIDYIEQMGS